MIHRDTERSTSPVSARKTGKRVLMEGRNKKEAVRMEGSRERETEDKSKLDRRGKRKEKHEEMKDGRKEGLFFFFVCGAEICLSDLTLSPFRNISLRGGRPLTDAR